MTYGRECEDIAQKEIEVVTKKEIKFRGLFIDLKDRRFAASPDGIIDGLVEITNSTSKEYYQVQGQLHVTQQNYCVFVLRTPKCMEIRVVRRDDDFWNSKIEPFLSQFYENCLLPEILNSRFLRNMQIRNPRYILDAIKKQHQKISDQGVKKSSALKNMNPDDLLIQLLETEKNRRNYDKIALTDLSVTHSTHKIDRLTIATMMSFTWV
ncbi:hypothetical protein TSAR_006784, partial [Trichomalopsis sarcophagae]